MSIALIDRLINDCLLEPNDKESVEATFVLQAKDYLKYLGEQPLVSGTFLAYIDEPEQAWVHKLPINLELPDLLIDINGKGNDNNNCNYYYYHYCR